MGIAGRRNLLLGKSSSRSNSSDPALDEEDLFDRLEGLKEEEGSGDDLGFEEDDEDIVRLRRANESSLRVNEDGELVEKRPLGVTLEDVSCIDWLAADYCRLASWLFPRSEGLILTCLASSNGKSSSISQ
jgi:hypothetical protein